MYPHDRNAFTTKLAQLARLMLDRGHQVGVVIQSDVGEHDSDRNIAAELQAREPRIAVLDCLAAGIDDCVGTLIGVLSLANIVVAVRYHAAVLRLIGGRRPYHLYYSRKGRDLHERLGLSGGPLEQLDPLTAVREIETTAHQTFDPAPVARDVTSAFEIAYRRLP